MICCAEEETRGENVSELHGAASRTRIVHGETEADCRLEVKKTGRRLREEINILSGCETFTDL